MKYEREPIGYELKGFTLSKILDSEFLGGLEKQGVEFAIDHVTIEFKDPAEPKTSSYVTIGYIGKKGKAEGRVTVTASNPDSLDYVVNALEKVD